MLDNGSKKSNNLTIIATNAGSLRTWQHEWREAYRDNPRWWWQKVSEPAPWIDPADVAEAQTRNSTSRFNRLWYGQWSSGEGDALDASDVSSCITLAGPMKQPRAGWVFVSGLDLGVKNDHSALVILGVELGSGKVSLADCQSWKPGRSGQVDLTRVREAHLEAWETYNLIWAGYDPSQAHLMAQDLANHGVPMEEWVLLAGILTGWLAIF
jgi:hypothetical protein